MRISLSSLFGGRKAPVTSPEEDSMQPHPYLIETRQALDAVLEYLAIVDGKLRQLEAEVAAAKPQVSSVDERIAAAASSTAVYVAIGQELGSGWDQRTVRGKVERLIEVHSLHGKYPEGSRDVGLAKYLAERMPDGRFRIQHAVEALT